ncbi:NAD(P)H-dependent oxidoreductase [Vibrio sp. SS-MA-C1-2]|uniref:NADPH-dependent FMN reductase n=1 Tax=Vibrio sp. SS-MA-C1-2 TaxID=2908646 RepID=UPI001F42EB99|nr:NAD(P)H-dependent oxidoreductase [Vibrio sp. SS-MA-C1-2]UJF17481.1 NAD(P)H-dependent oxidoreductase [Vibrio sp. SS-MA-C1-2]
MKILAIGASTSTSSINQKLASYAASLISGATVTVLDLNQYDMPIFSEQLEKEVGQQPNAKAFFEELGKYDAIVISFAEHNGHYTAAFKNIFDWTTRVNREVYQNIPTIMLATSPGPGGAQNVLAAATGSAPFFAGNVKGQLSVPNFYSNFDLEENKIINADIEKELQETINKLL